MRLGKLLIVSAAVAALAGVMATGAFAAEISAKYADGVVTISNCPTFEGDKTLLVLNTGEEGEALTSVTENDIKQIDQQADGYTDVVVGDLPAGTYEVRVGGDGNIATCLFEVVGEVDPENPWADSTRLLGNVDGAGLIDNTDVIYVINHNVGNSILEGEDLQAADADDSGEVNNTDAVTIQNYLVGNDTTTIDGVKTVADKDKYVPAN